MRLLESFLDQHTKVDALWERISKQSTAEQNRSCRGRVLAALRYGHLLDRLIELSCKRPPKSRLRALLLIAGGEWLASGLSAPDTALLARCANHAVETAKQHLSTGEARFVNALLRRWPEILQTHFPTTNSRLLASCPKPLLQRWQKQFDESQLLALLEWNLGESRNWLYYPNAQAIPAELLTPSPWPDFFELPAGPIDPAIANLLAQGKAYIKDPSTRVAVEALDLQPGESVLDLCAAPGGKSFHIAHALQFKGQLVAVDLPANRQLRLADNLTRLQRGSFAPKAVAADLLQVETADLLKAEYAHDGYSKVLIDVPCSNTGVLRRRPDVSWRLDKAAYATLEPLQRDLLAAAARCVTLNGTLVYSTCSIEADENNGRIEAFLASDAGRDFRLEAGEVHYPWQSGHDGGGVFKLKRTQIHSSSRVFRARARVAAWKGPR
jgi:16S rRNA (cytosine967-C5)-methyltransferase